jgi:hypothetical protein
MARDFTTEDSNEVLVQASFDRWKSGTGGPFELLAPDAEWTIIAFFDNRDFDEFWNRVSPKS